MKSFLDEGKARGNHVFLLYGATNDFFCPTSAQLMNLDHMLLSFLKSKGYDHVLYYNGSGNGGKHCFDEESSRFFFPQNDRVTAEETSPENISEDETPEDQMNDMLGITTSAAPARRRYVPTGSQPEAADTAANGSERRLRVGQTGIENVELIRELCGYIAKGEKIAIVISNVLDFITDDSNRRFYDSIMNTMSSTAECETVCIFCVPGDAESGTIANSLSTSPLSAKFISMCDGHPRLREDTCVNIGAPGEDEIANLLYRYTLPLNRKRLMIDFNQLENIAHELRFKVIEDMTAAKSDLNLQNLTLRSMKNLLSDWIDEQEETEIPFTRDTVFSLPPQKKRPDLRPAIEKLNRPGWENIYLEVSRILNLNAIHRRKAGHTAQKPDICIGRFERRQSAGEVRYMPNIGIVIEGPPGVGKSTAARLIGRALYEAGILSSGHTVEVTKAQLTSSFHTETPRAVIACADRAEGGCLFVDEAMELGVQDGGVNNEGSTSEVVSTLNNIMTDPNRNICVILAGYSAGMEKLLDSDPGLRSRFKYNIRIEDYQPELLESILLNHLKNEYDCRFADDIYDEEAAQRGERQPLDNYLEHTYVKRDRESFANARSMEDFAAQLAERAAKDRTAEIRRSYMLGESVCSRKTLDGEVETADDSWFEPIDPQDSFEQLVADIRTRFVGFEFLIEHFEKIYSYVKESIAKGILPENIPIKPVALIGRPGAGKDAAAGLFLRLYRLLNIFNYPELLRHSGGELASTLTGGSIKTAEEWIAESRAKNAMIFLNEAQQLINDHFDGHGALSAFCAPMTDRHPFTMVIALYPEFEERFFALEPGMTSRFEKIYLPDYDDKQLYEIAKKMAAANKMNIEEKAYAIISRIVVRMDRERMEDSGNARQIENLLKDMEMNRRLRAERQKIPYDAPERYICLAEDIPESYLVNLPMRSCNDDVSDFSELEHEFERSIVGQRHILKQFENLANELLEYRQLEAKGMKVEKGWRKAVILVGPPGVGKTAIANLLASMYNMLGEVRTPEAFIVNASSFASTYQNGARDAAKKLIAEAVKRHMLLVIDEGHQLLNLHDGKDAVEAFLSHINSPDPEQRVNVVFTVYPERLAEFIAIDPGLGRRVNVIELNTYSAEELLRIFRIKAEGRCAVVSEETADAVLEACRTLVTLPETADRNAAAMEDLLEEMQINRRARCKREGIPASDERYMHFVPEDVPERLRNS